MNGHVFPVVDGIPIMLRDDVSPTHGAIAKSLAEVRENRVDELRVEIEANGIDPVVQVVIGATCGHLYQPLIGKLRQYPIPQIRLPRGRGETCLDVGCSWGRWTIAAARQGYKTVGIDPDLGTVLAAQRIATQLGVDASYVVGDARYLPFAKQSFDKVISYSVLQHFSRDDVRLALGAIAQTLKTDGLSTVQMPNAYGVRSTFHRVRNRSPREFDVRYWTPQELTAEFEATIGPSKLEIDGFFGLGIQSSDLKMLPMRYKLIVVTSSALRKMAKLFPVMLYVADSLYVVSSRAS